MTLRWLAEPHKFFLAFCVTFGLIALAMIPPYMVPDEQAHLTRAYQVSTGGLAGYAQNGATGANVPVSLQRDAFELFKLSLDGGHPTHKQFMHYLTTKIDTHDIVFAAFPTTSVYSALPYLPQAAGMAVARLVYPSNLSLLYTGRLVNLIVFIGFIYAAIKLIPVGKWFMTMAALLPMTLQQAASLSSDVTSIGLAFLAVAYFLHLYVSSPALGRKQLVYIGLIGVGLGLTKQTNALIMLPFLWLAVRGNATRSERARIAAVAVLPAFGAAIAWYAVTKALHFNLDYSGLPGVTDVNRQLSYVLHNPAAFLKVLYHTFIFNGTGMGATPDFYWQSMAGAFSWIRYNLPLGNVILAYIGLLVALLYRQTNMRQIELPRLVRASGLFVFVVSILAIGVVLYLVWTPLKYPVIGGIQGRYFIPLLPLLILFATTKSYGFTIHRPGHAILLFAGIISINFAAMAFVTLSYYKFI